MRGSEYPLNERMDMGTRVGANVLETSACTHVTVFQSASCLTELVTISLAEGKLLVLLLLGRGPLQLQRGHPR